MDKSATESGEVAVPAQWTSGGTGAVPALSTFRYAQRLKSVSRNSAGNFTLVYGEGVVGITGFSGQVIQATPSGGGLFVKLTVNNMGATTSPSITVQVQNAAGTATDPANGDVIMLRPIFQYMDAIAGK